MSANDQTPGPIEPNEDDPRIQAALEELRGLMLERFPAASFSVTRGADPAGVYLNAIVDAADLDEVTGSVFSRIVGMQVDEGSPVFVVPDWPIERVRA